MKDPTRSIFTSVFALLWFIAVNTQGQSFVNSRDDIQISYEVHGDNSPTLLFVHGWSCDRTYWSGQLQPLSHRFTVVALDLAGHGDSGMGRNDYTIKGFAGDVEAVVKKLDLKGVILIGHSMGGDVIAEAARSLKDRVLGLVMVDTYKQLRKPRSPEEVEKFVARFRDNFVEQADTLVRSMFLPSSDRSLVDRVASDMSSAPPGIALDVMEAALSYSREMSVALDELKLPVVAINPDNTPTDIESMKRFGVEVIIMPHASHFLMMEDPERFNQFLSIAIDKLKK